MPSSLKEYEKLIVLGKEIHLFSSISQLLEWDQETYLPKGGAEVRASQLELLASLTHQKQISSSFKKTLSKLIQMRSGKIVGKGLTQSQKRALIIWRKDFLNEERLPNSFVKAFAKTTSEAISAWKAAKRENHFPFLAPHLKKIIELNKEKGRLLNPKVHPYDALIDFYEPGMKRATLRFLFQKLKPFLISLIRELSKKTAIEREFLRGIFSEVEQRKFSHFLLKTMGIDPSYVRLDDSEHPFCVGLHPRDIRITSHLSSSGFMHNISAILHEGGHALYHQGILFEHIGTPLGASVSSGMQESQARFYETIIGLGLPFWHYAYPKLQESFPEHLGKVDLITFYKAINCTKPSLIRVGADEVTYILHIILRFEIEEALLEERVEVEELPTVWSQKMEELFGIFPKNDQEGCLQDIHWAAGLIGYFPTYALGNLYAAQFFKTIRQKYLDWKEKIVSGNLLFLNEFFHEHIYRYGREFSPAELLEKATASPLKAEPYIEYLTEKYSSSGLI